MVTEVMIKEKLVQILIPHSLSLFKSVHGLLKTESRIYARGIFRKRISKEVWSGLLISFYNKLFSLGITFLDKNEFDSLQV